MKTRSVVLRNSGVPTPFTSSLPLTIEELDLAPPGPGELAVRVESAGVCHSDLSVVTGARPRPLPMALGHEAAGVVTDLGPGVEDVRIGAHVVLVFVPSCGACTYCTSGRPALCPAGAAANGSGELLGGGRRLTAADGPINHHLGVSAFGERVVVDRSSAVIVDDDVPFDVAAVLGCAMLTGFGAVHNTAAVAAGDSVTVIGLGGVGQAAILGAAAARASVILAVDPVEHKRALAIELGATHACSPRDAEGVLGQLTGGGTRWVFEAVGSAPVMEQGFALTARGGTMVSVGLPAPDAVLRLPALAFVSEAKTLTGSYMGSSVPQRDIPRMVRRWKDGALPVEKLISDVLPLAEINLAFDRLADGQAVRQLIHPHA